MGEKPKKYDFGGWATRNDLVCTDGRTIRKDAFAHNDKKTVPLFWQHAHTALDKVLGHVVLENREEGVFAHGVFNDTYLGKTAKEQVRHGDLTALSIYAVRVQQVEDDVLHGDISEVSLVAAGANPGAYIEYVNFGHADNSETEMIIYTGEEIQHSDTEGSTMLTDTEKKKKVEPETEESEETVKEVLSSMTDKQKAATYFLIEEALNSAKSSKSEKKSKKEKTPSEKVPETVVQQNDDDVNHLEHENKEGLEMARNVFDQSQTETRSKAVFTHSQMSSIIDQVPMHGGSLKASVLAHAQEYGIKDIDFLFPETRNLTSTPEMISRQVDWVKDFLGSVKKTPFSRIKTILADITADEARARGYAKNTLKKEEVIALLKRTTTPTTVYKKQKLDRDDVIDITEFDVIVWIKAEMRLMLEEELARAILMGDGRLVGDDAHIQDPKGSNNGAGIRSILHDDDMYTQKVTVPTVLQPDDYVDAIIRSRVHYRGTGTPNFYTTDTVLTEILMAKDRNRRRIYRTEKELADALRVSKIVPVEAMEYDKDLLGIIVNPRDYTVGADKGGETNFFDDFDIDWNQLKYLLETRLSGALTKPKSAIALLRAEGTQVIPSMPGFESSTNTLTIPEVVGVDYYIDDAPVTGEIVIDENTEVVAHPQAGYMFPVLTTNTWTYTYVG